MRDGRAIPASRYIAIGLISAAALAYQVMLTRLLAIVHWDHFAGMVISLALLGYGASGTALHLLREPIQRRGEALFVIHALAFAAAAPLCFQWAQALPLNPSELPWDPTRWWHLAAVYLLLALPFFAAANCIGIALMRSGPLSNRVYASDLLGAGAGALAVVPMLWLLPPGRLLPAIGIVALLAAAVAGGGLRRRSRAVTLLAVATLLTLPWLLPATLFEVQPAPYKDLSRARDVVGAQLIAQRASPLSQLTLLTNTQIPFRFAPGLSLRAPAPPPPQQALFVDGAAAAAVPSAVSEDDARGYLAATLSALPYRLLQQPRTLLVGLNGGTGLLQALQLGARRVTVAEHDRARIALVFQHARSTLADPRVEIVHSDARSLLAGDSRRYELIRLDRWQGGSAGGLAAQRADYALTTEAIDSYLQRLAPGGMLAVDLWLELPPRAVLKLVATALDSLERLGVAEPERRLVVVRGWKTVSVLIAADDLDGDRITAVREFCRSLDFDPVFFAGIGAEELNRHHRLDTPLVHAGVTALAGPDASRFRDRYAFLIDPASDDRPYFDDFSRWRSLPALLTLPARGGFAHVDWGYWLQYATLAQALLFGVALIVLPLLLARRGLAPAGRIGRGYAPRMLSYFFTLGVAFIAIEIAYLKQLELLFGQPVLAMAVTLAGFLISAGIGSAVSARLLRGCHRRLRLLAVTITLLVFAELWLLTQLMPILLGLPLTQRLLVALALIAPLGWCMGMPFPWGLSRLSGEAPALIPWAWGLNGLASVLAAIVAGLLAISFGFSTLLAGAALLYPLAALLTTRASWSQDNGSAAVTV